MRKISTMKKTIFFIGLAIATACFGEETLTIEVPKTIVTNLNDKLHTQVTIDNATGMDIRRLNLDSIHADKHKSRYTTVKSLKIDVPTARRVVMVKPLSTINESGNKINVDNTYIDSFAVRKLDKKNIIVNSLTTKNMLVTDLSPSVFYLNGGKLSLVGTKGRGSSVYDANNLNVNSIHPYTINVSEYGVNALAVSSITINNESAKKIDISNLNLNPIETKKLEANLLAVNKLKPTVINLTDASSTMPVMVIDNTRFNVEITEDIYAELAEMKLIYNFEQDYNESLKTEVKLNDIRKLDRNMYVKWIKILAANKKCSISYIKNKKLRKIIGEAWIYNNRYNFQTKENMLKNLDFFKSKGYGAVLVRFDCSEDKDKLIELVDDIKAAGFEVFGAYVGQDNLTPAWNPYIEPETIEEYISLLAPKFTGFLLNWRTTSNHVKILPIEYFNYICNTLRKANDKILIYGEVYYGNIDPLRMRTLIYTAPENVTGIVINNMGYYGYNTTYIVNNLFASAVPRYRKIDKLGQVIGYGPYYSSRPEFNAHLDLDQEYKYKEHVETAFKRTGYGTITMSHDGVDDNFTNVIADPTDEKHYFDTTDNILYDIKIWKALEKKSAEEAQKAIEAPNTNATNALKESDTANQGK